MPYWDRRYGDRQSRMGGGDQSQHREPHRQNGGGVLRNRQGRMNHDHHQLTGHGGHGGFHQSPAPAQHGHGSQGNKGRGGRH
jgi:hypothetical protein